MKARSFWCLAVLATISFPEALRSEQCPTAIPSGFYGQAAEPAAAVLNVTPNLTTLETGCAVGSIAGPVVLKSLHGKRSFSQRGMYVSVGGAPPGPDTPALAPVAVQFTGFYKTGMVVFVVTFADGRTEGPYRLHLGHDRLPPSCS